MKKDWNFLLGAAYQYVVLIAVVVLLLVVFFSTGVLNEILLGALIGTMISMPFKSDSGRTVDTDTLDKNEKL